MDLIIHSWYVSVGGTSSPVMHVQFSLCWKHCLLALYVTNIQYIKDHLGISFIDRVISEPGIIKGILQSIYILEGNTVGNGCFA